MVKLIFKCPVCGYEEGKLILCDNDVFVKCANQEEECQGREEIDYTRWG